MDWRHKITIELTFENFCWSCTAAHIVVLIHILNNSQLTPEFLLLLPSSTNWCPNRYSQKSAHTLINDRKRLYSRLVKISTFRARQHTGLSSWIFSKLCWILIFHYWTNFWLVLPDQSHNSLPNRQNKIKGEQTFEIFYWSCPAIQEWDEIWLFLPDKSHHPGLRTTYRKKTEGVWWGRGWGGKQN